MINMQTYKKYRTFMAYEHKILSFLPLPHYIFCPLVCRIPTNTTPEQGECDTKVEQWDRFNLKKRLLLRKLISKKIEW